MSSSRKRSRKEFEDINIVYLKCSENKVLAVALTDKILIPLQQQSVFLRLCGQCNDLFKHPETNASGELTWPQSLNISVDSVKAWLNFLRSGYMSMKIYVKICDDILVLGGCDALDEWFQKEKRNRQRELQHYNPMSPVEDKESRFAWVVMYKVSPDATADGWSLCSRTSSRDTESYFYYRKVKN